MTKMLGIGLILSASLSMLLLGGCSPKQVEEIPEKLNSEASISFDITSEPPLNEEALDIAVPDFLSEDQQALYRRAYSLYMHLFGGETSEVEYSETLEMDVFPPKEYETTIINSIPYFVSQGRYSNWDDFDTVIHSVFTDNFWSSHNKDDKNIPIYGERKNQLCFRDLSKSCGYLYNRNFPDEFCLFEQTNHSITFTLIGHYSVPYPKSDETFEQRDERLSKAYEYTLKFPIKMVLTPDGWRFEEFHSALADEDE